MGDPTKRGQDESAGVTHRRRVRYAGKYPRRFAEKYKEHDPNQYAETVAKVLAAGKTPAGTHRPIMVAEVLQLLDPRPGEIAVDCTLGYGGHAGALLNRVLPGGKLVGLDADPIELPKTEARLRALGFGPESFRAWRSNFAGLAQVLAAEGLEEVDLLFADLGVSSMQLDDPVRGFSLKNDGPLDMRMNPRRGQPASALLARISPPSLALLFQENADEPHALALAQALAGRQFESTFTLAGEIRSALSRLGRQEQEESVRRAFQALRIAVNDELGALDSLLRQLPGHLRPGGRAAFLTFHSGEDRRVKKAFLEGRRCGVFGEISADAVRPSAEERYQNPRSAPAKLRWARKVPPLG